MNNEDIYSRLTPSAQEALNKLTIEYRDELLQKAFLIAQERETANKEISLRDILESNQPKVAGTNRLKSESRKKRLFYLITLSGVVYSILGILLYLIQNKKFIVETDLGLIIALSGIIISMTAFLYTQILSKRTFELKVLERTDSNYNDFDVVKRWQIIEQLTIRLMSEKGIIDPKSRSLSQVIKFLTENFAQSEKDFLKTRELLQVRNRVLHEQFSMTDQQKKEYLDFANSLIEKLEKAQD
jgi:hypothetical protein